MTEQPPFDPKRRRKIVISACLMASAGLFLGWMAWRTYHLRQQVKALEENMTVIMELRVQSTDDIESYLDNLTASQPPTLTNQSASEVNSGNVEPNESSREATDIDKEQLDLALALENYYIWSLSHRKAALQSQLVKDNILFITTLVIVGFGLYLSYLQFKKVEQTEGSLKLGPAGIEITSSILGIFILAFSVGFFYLYLVHVFPIEEMGQENLPPVPATNSEGQ